MSPEQKLIFLYLHTCPASTQCGVFKLPVKTASFQLGYTNSPLESALRGLCSAFPDFVAWDGVTGEIALLQYPKQTLIEANNRVLSIVINELKEVKSVYLLQQMIAQNSATIGKMYLSRLRQIQMQNVNNSGDENVNVIPYVDLTEPAAIQQLAPEIEIEIEIERKSVQIEDLHVPSSFENFWQLFGYKKNRKKAESAFNHLPKYKQQICIEKIPAYLAFIAGTNTPQMHPTTWINGERWDDDFTIPANGKKIVNTDAALKDADLPKELHAGYAAYISGMIEKFPALWKSECRVLSQMEWAVFQGDHLTPAQRIALTPQGAAKLRGNVHRVLNQDNFSRAKYTRVYDAIMEAYRAACAGETMQAI